MCGVENGVYDCPASYKIIPFLCSLFEDDPYHFLFNGSIPLSFSDYFVTFWNRTEYLGQNTFLPYLNNEIPGKHNATYTSNFRSLEKVLLGMALNDTVVYPHESEQFGGYAFTDGDKDTKTVYTMREWSQYKNDAFGLRTLDEAGKISFAQFQGDHLRFSDEWWNAVVLPVFA